MEKILKRSAKHKRDSVLTAGNEDVQRCVGDAGHLSSDDKTDEVSIM